MGPLQLYKKLITGYHRRYGPSVWHVYQADTRTDGQNVASSGGEPGAKKEGQVTDFKPDRPWNTVWHDVINDVTWWRYEHEEPALLYFNRKAATVSQVGHDARTSFSNNVVAEADRGISLQSAEPPNEKRLTGDKEPPRDHRRPLHSQQEGQAVVPGLQVLEHGSGHMVWRPSRACSYVW